MTDDTLDQKRDLHDRIRADMIDGLDEELEMEFDDARLDALIAPHGDGSPATHDLNRQYCFACSASWSSFRTGSCTRS